MNRIEEDIKNRTFAGIYLIYGEEDYLRRYYVKKLRRAILPEGDEMNLTTWKEDAFDLKAFSEQAVTLPFFAEHRLLIVENSSLFKKGGNDLAAFLSRLPEETIVIFSEKEADKRGKLFKLVASKGAVWECRHPDEEALTRWVLQQFSREGRKIQRSAMQLFLERTGNEMDHISQEIKKLLAYTEGRDAILLEDVKQLTTENTEAKVFALINEMSGRRTGKAISLYNELIAEKGSAIMILVVMGRQFETLCRVKELREQGMNQDSISDKLGLQGYQTRRILGQAARFTSEELSRAFALCVRTDEDIKSGRIRDTLAVETLIVQVTMERGDT